jgi:hypothetical protein
MFRRKPKPDPPRHRGRVWHDAELDMWRYACRDCDWGAGSAAAGTDAFPWLIYNATAHAAGYLASYRSEALRRMRLPEAVR